MICIFLGYKICIFYQMILYLNGLIKNVLNFKTKMYFFCPNFEPNLVKSATRIFKLTLIKGQFKMIYFKILMIK